MSTILLTSESVAEGHPDKVADQIADAILDASLEQDPQAKVACEVLVTTGQVILAGEISNRLVIDHEKIARQVIQDIGYTDSALGFDCHSCGILSAIQKQSPDILQGVDGRGLFKEEQGAGDQGMMFGFACDETEEMMPLSITLSHRVVRTLKAYRQQNTLSYLRPDGKTQFTIEYDTDHHPKRIHTVVLSVQHDETCTHSTLCQDMRQLIEEVSPKGMIDDRTRFFINPTGRFVIGGPHGDTGLTGRKTVVDTYGGAAHHGGGAFSGKDPTKVDRSGAYAARYVAKNIIAAKLARRCEVQLSFAIGVPYPISIHIDTFGTATVDERLLEAAIPKAFDLTPYGIIEMLRLQRPIYQKTAFGGHFGRHDPDFTWEQTDKVDALLDALIALQK